MVPGRIVVDGDFALLIVVVVDQMLVEKILYLNECGIERSMVGTELIADRRL